MAKKMPATPRAARITARTDVVTRVSADAVSDRAYHLFQARGSEHGHDVEDWLVAETELLDGVTTELASPFEEPLRYSMAPRTVPALVSRFTNPRPPVQDGTTPCRVEDLGLTEGAALRWPDASGST